MPPGDFYSDAGYSAWTDVYGVAHIGTPYEDDRFDSADPYGRTVGELMRLPSDQQPEHIRNGQWVNSTIDGAAEALEPQDHERREAALYGPPHAIGQNYGAPIGSPYPLDPDEVRSRDYSIDRRAGLASRDESDHRDETDLEELIEAHLADYPKSDEEVRVYEIARELGVTSKVVLAILAEMGERVRSASSSIVPPVADKLRAALGQPGAGTSNPVRIYELAKKYELPFSSVLATAHELGATAYTLTTAVEPSVLSSLRVELYRLKSREIIKAASHST